MAYNEKLADRIREALQHLPKVEEKKMFRGVTFMVNGKMCVSISGEELMFHFDPALQETVAEKNGFKAMIMKGREYKGYGYINQEGIKSKKILITGLSFPLVLINVRKHLKKVSDKMSFVCFIP